ncbi:MAG: dihydrolipoyl dehydrogenase [Deltaproteobacteria bacterium]|nr:dihydrolipoyl dehydrogenase [Deltaproteobacteria bacterium]
MTVPHYDLVVIGAGPGGYVCAIRAAQLGLETAVVEMYPRLGGTCLNVGCIPSKALLESSERYAAAKHDLGKHGVKVGQVELDLDTMHARRRAIVAQLTGGVELLFKKNKIDWLRGRGSIGARVGAGWTVDVAPSDGLGEGPRAVTADAVVIATGSVPSALRGVAFDGERIIDSTGALEIDKVPDHLVLVGAGVIGLELGSVWARLGARVTVLEYLDRILPGIDLEIANEAQRIFERQGLAFTLGARVKSATRSGDAVTVAWSDAAGKDHAVTGDYALVAVGRRPYTDGLGLEHAGVRLDERGRVLVDDAFQTTAGGIFAIGDCIRGAMLAHKAEDEGIAVAETLAGQVGHVNYDAIPSIVYTHPEVAGVGKTEEELTAAGVPFVRGRFRFGPNGRALALGETDGQVKILAHKETDRILGCHILGPRAGDLIAEVAVAIEFGASSEDLARSCHAHPTLSEVVREAALDCARRALHK